MADVHSTAARRRNMAAIRSKNTKPELLVRQSLHAAGYRYTLHNKKLPGRPDIVLPKHGAAILINGCFFHGHECEKFRWPATRAEFWRDKIGGNRERDKRNVALLREAGWRVLVVWECAIRGDQASKKSALAKIVRWVGGRSAWDEIAEPPTWPGSCRSSPVRA
jgi:DNA mismatch endonuclease, patch repair protein